MNNLRQPGEYLGVGVGVVFFWFAPRYQTSGGGNGCVRYFSRLLIDASGVPAKPLLEVGCLSPMQPYALIHRRCGKDF